MSYHTTHNQHYILIEPEYEYFEIEDIDLLIDQILGDINDIAHIIVYLGSLNFLDQDDMDQFLFLNAELKAQGGFLIMVTQDHAMIEQLNQKIALANTIDDAMDSIESEWTDKELFS